MKKCIITLTGLLLHSNAQAAPPNWQLLSQGSDSESYVDIGNIRDENGLWGRYRTAWIKRVLNKSEINGTKYRLVKKWYNCQNRSDALSEMVLYNENGNVIDSFTWSVPEFSSSPPGTVGDTVIEFVCSR